MLMIVIGTQLVKTPFWGECTNQLTVRSHFGRIIHNFGTNGRILAYEGTTQQFLADFLTGSDPNRATVLPRALYKY